MPAGARRTECPWPFIPTNRMPVWGSVSVVPTHSYCGPYQLSSRTEWEVLMCTISIVVQRDRWYIVWDQHFEIPASFSVSESRPNWPGQLLDLDNYWIGEFVSKKWYNDHWIDPTRRKNIDDSGLKNIWNHLPTERNPRFLGDSFSAHPVELADMEMFDFFSLYWKFGKFYGEHLAEFCSE